MTSEHDHDIVGLTMRGIMNQGESVSWDMTPEAVRRNARGGWMRVLPKTSHLVVGAGVAAVLIAVLSIGRVGTAPSPRQSATEPTVAVRPPATPSTSSTSTVPATSTTSPATTTTSPGNGQWADPVLTISPQGLGAVRIGMTVGQAQAAAGITLYYYGDGMMYPYPMTTPYPSQSAAVRHLYVGINGTPYVGGNPNSPNLNAPIWCVGASSSTQTVRTPDGFQLGQSVATLLRIYGSRAKPVTTTSGIDPGPGYLVTEPGGNLFFYVDTSSGTILHIAAGTGVKDSNSCSG